MTACACRVSRVCWHSHYWWHFPSWLWRQQFACFDAEDVCDVEEPFVEQSAPPMFNLNEHVARHSRLERECFLCQSLLDAQRPNPLTNRLAVSGPRLQSARVDLRWACWHPFSTR